MSNRFSTWLQPWAKWQLFPSWLQDSTSGKTWQVSEANTLYDTTLELVQKAIQATRPPRWRWPSVQISSSFYIPSQEIALLSGIVWQRQGIRLLWNPTSGTTCSLSQDFLRWSTPEELQQYHFGQNRLVHLAAEAVAQEYNWTPAGAKLDEWLRSATWQSGQVVLANVQLRGLSSQGELKTQLLQTDLVLPVLQQYLSLAAGWLARRQISQSHSLSLKNTLIHAHPDVWPWLHDWLHQQISYT